MGALAGFAARAANVRGTCTGDADPTQILLAAHAIHSAVHRRGTCDGPMHPGEPQLANIIGEALRAVELQKLSHASLLSADARAQRAALFHFLNSAAQDLFALVARAAAGKERQVRVTDVELLAQRLPNIFRRIDGSDFNAEMFNEWLFVNDLSHHFHTDGIFLKW